VVKGHMLLNEAGEMAADCWRAIPTHFPHAAIDAWVIMPEHVHGIIEIGGPCVHPVGAKNLSPFEGGTNGTAGDVEAKNLSPFEGAKDLSPLRPHGTSRTVGSIVRGFKIGVTMALGSALWQRNYYEIIIHDEATLQNIRWDIQQNPLNYDVVMNCGEPRALGNRALLDGPKLGFLASRGETEAHGHLLILSPFDMSILGYRSFLF